MTDEKPKPRWRPPSDYSLIEQLSDPTYGYDENGLWMGKTPEELRKFYKEVDEAMAIYDLEPASKSIN